MEKLLELIDKIRIYNNIADELRYKTIKMLDMVCGDFNVMERIDLWSLIQALPSGFHKEELMRYYSNKWGDNGKNGDTKQLN